MRKPFETFFAVTGAVVWIGAIPLALAAFGNEGWSSTKTWSQRIQEWPEQARAARHKLEAEGKARQHRIEAQAVADLNAIEIHRHKLAACEKEGGELNLRFLSRRTFVYQCMRRS
jgi:hypothetical protein